LRRIVKTVPQKCFYDDKRIMALASVHASKKNGDYSDNLECLIGKLQEEKDLPRKDQMLYQVQHFKQAVKMHENFERRRVRDRCIGGAIVLGCEALAAALCGIAVLATKLATLNETYTPE